LTVNQHTEEGAQAASSSVAAPRANIEVSSLTYYYPGKQPLLAISNTSFHVGDGEFVSIIGPSGCGKSTMLRLLADLLKPTRGEISISGQTPEKMRKSRQIGFVFQDAALMPWRSANGNVMLPLQVMRKGGKQGKAKSREMLNLVGLGEFGGKRPSELSGGMRQRVSIARALTYSPQVLLMDEPFGALDQLTRDEMNQELLRIWEANRTTLVFVTHSIAEAVFLSDRVLVMSPRPGTVRASIDIKLSRPRKPEIKHETAFFEHETKVLNALEGRA
jgi:NitT/TauT family transport system ATP-binding protein